jgi:hypothetical protein
MGRSEEGKGMTKPRLLAPGSNNETLRAQIQITRGEIFSMHRSRLAILSRERLSSVIRIPLRLPTLGLVLNPRLESAA